MLWDVFMFAGELPMLTCRMTEFDAWIDLSGLKVRHVIVEASQTHRGVPKPLVFDEQRGHFTRWRDRITYVHTDLPSVLPWTREHLQRDAAWETLDDMAGDGDLVLLGDLDEIPTVSCGMFENGWFSSLDAPVALNMRTAVFAVDWETPGPLPTGVIAPMGWLRGQRPAGLGEIRDGRARYAQSGNCGWHLSWLGGPQEQRRKLEERTCHTEIFATAEAELIRTGQRWSSPQAGGGLPVVPVDVDHTWPLFVQHRLCPPAWFRPRND